MARKLTKVSDLKGRKTAGGASPYYDGATFEIKNAAFGYANDRKEIYVVYPASVRGEEFWLQMLLKGRKTIEGRIIAPEQTTEPELDSLRVFSKNAGGTADSQIAAFEAAFGLPSNWDSANCEVIRIMDNDAEFISIKILNYVPATPAPATPPAPAAPVAPVAPTA